MDLKKIFIKNACPTKIGGQAILEGIMMRGPDRTAVAMRRPDGGVHLKVEPLKKPGKGRKIPILRGVLAFIDSLVTGTGILLYSAEVLEGFETPEGESVYEEDKFSIWLKKRFGEKGALNVMLYMSVILAIVFTVGVFIILPTALISAFRHVVANEVALNVMEGVLRILMFIVYIAAISRMQDIRTVFQYHGAEHKTIHCYENGLPLTPENAQKFETLHPRCGTSFLMFVMVISLLLFSLLGWPNLVWRIVSRLLLIPIIAGLSYELLQWAGRSASPVVKFLSIPGLALQKLSTKAPTDQQLEIAIVAMNAVLSEEEPRFYIAETDENGDFVEDKEKEAEALARRK